MLGRIFDLEQIYRAYTERFTHTDMEETAEGTLVPITYRPNSVCNRLEVEACWRLTATNNGQFWSNSQDRLNAALDLMRTKVGEARSWIS